jgi:triosephosphate isomerase
VSKLIVANWKMHNDPHQASLLAHRLTSRFKDVKKTEVVLCPPFVDLWTLARDHERFKLGAQNMHWAEEGTYTGEISANMLKGMVQYVIIGHSERRAMGETDRDIAKKVAAAVRHKLTPILCVGDNLLERTHGHASRVIAEQVTAGLAQVTEEELRNVVVAYEPVWAISTGDGQGRYATIEEVKPMVTLIRQTVEELHEEGAGADVKVLYGGSVNPDNAMAYLKIDGMDGLLVGGASLIADEFAKIVLDAEKLEEPKASKPKK